MEGIYFGHGNDDSDSSNRYCGYYFLHQHQHHLLSAHGLCARYWAINWH